MRERKGKNMGHVLDTYLTYFNCCNDLQSFQVKTKAMRNRAEILKKKQLLAWIIKMEFQHWHV